MKRTITALLLITASTGLARSADPIVGNWLTHRGQTAAITACGRGFCVTLTTGNYAGEQIGFLNKKGDGYAGKVTDPANDKTYKGKASIAGTVLNMKGCILGGLICQTQKWTRK